MAEEAVAEKKADKKPEKSERSVKEIPKLSAIQKCALLLIAFGPEIAGDIMRNFTEKEGEKISIAIATMHNIPVDVLSETIEEFYQKNKANTGLMNCVR